MRIIWKNMSGWLVVAFGLGLWFVVSFGVTL